MKFLKKLYYRWFPTYRRIELRILSWNEADKLIRGNENKISSDQWVLAEEEDNNQILGIVFLERKERIK